MRRLPWVMPLTVAAVGLATPLVPVFVAGGQSAPLTAPLQLADRGPVFFSVAEPGGERVDARGADVLRRRIALELDDVSLADALDAVSRVAGLPINYSRAMLPPAARVSLGAHDITTEGALTVLLLDTRLDVRLAGGQATLVPRGPALPASRLVRQQGRSSITGRVADGVTGSPLDQTAVRVEGPGVGALSAADGHYTIRAVPPGTYRVIARRVGYAPLTKTVLVAADSVTTVDFALVPAPTTLSAIVTTALGDQRRYEVGNVISTINVDSVARTAPVTSLTDLISARAPGVDVEENSGLTGSGEAIRIRGISSLVLQGDPILIVDGVRVDNAAGGNSITYFGPYHGAHMTPTRLNDIDFSDVQTVDVLKGPAASTEYGTDAANGVIVITTKRAATGAPQWHVSAEQTASTMPASFPNNYYSWGHTTDATRTPIDCPMLQSPYDGITASWPAGTCVVDSITQWSPLNHARTSIFTTGNRGKYDLQVGGGTAAVRYFVSGGLSNETGVAQMPPIFRSQAAAAGIPTSFDNPNREDQRSIRGNTSITLGPTTDLSFSASYLDTYQQTPETDFLLQGVGTAPAIDDSAHYYGYGVVSYGGEGPLGELAQRGTQSTTRVLGGATASWHPVAWLASHVTLGLDHGAQRLEQLNLPGLSTAPLYVTSFYGLVNQTTDIYTVDGRATATVPLSASLRSATSAGVQLTDTRVQGQSAYETGTLTRQNLSLNGATGATLAQAGVQQATLGGYVEEQASYRDRLFVTGALRIDAGSGFGSHYNIATYPKASVSWLTIGQGPLTVRLRGAYGENGVQPTPGSALQIYNATPILQGGQPSTSYQLFWPGNPNLRPERSQELEGGVDVQALGNRLALQLTAFSKTTNDALVNEALGWDLGAAYTYQFNVGEIRNTGLEATLDATPIDTRRVNWTLTFNTSWLHNILVHLAPGIPPQSLFAYSGYTRQEPGYPLYGFWAPQVRYADANHDGVIGPTEITVADSNTYTGASLPTREMSLASHLGLWHGRIAVGALVDYRGGNKIANTAAEYAAFADNQREENVRGAPFWLQARAQAVYTGSYTPNLYYEDADFVRWRELSATYTLPIAVARVARLHAVSLTGAIRNLTLVWSRYSGPDPETTVNTGLSQSVTPTVSGNVLNNNLREDVGAVPLTRAWVLRLNADF